VSGLECRGNPPVTCLISLNTHLSPPFPSLVFDLRSVSLAFYSSLDPRHLSLDTVANTRSKKLPFVFSFFDQHLVK
jgi:hypothetical protein